MKKRQRSKRMKKKMKRKSDFRDRTLKKQTPNQGFVKGEELSSYCDLISSFSFIYRQ